MSRDDSVLQGRRTPSSRAPLSRERITARALAFIDETGVAGLSMRRLGDTLGVEAMSLYRYVPGREALLDSVVETMVEEMHGEDGIVGGPAAGWQDFLQRMAHGVRRVALTHPRAFPLVASRPPEAPWLRPPLRSLSWVEAFLSGLRSEGFSDEAAVAAYRSFTSFLLGHLLLEVAALGAEVGPLDGLDQGEDLGRSLADYPTVERLGAALAENHAATEFEDALEELLNRIALVRSET